MTPSSVSDTPESTPRAAWREAPSVARLALPVVTALATGSTMGLVDSAIVGRLGAVPLAVVALASSVWIIFIAALYGFLQPVGFLVARAFGARDADQVATERLAGRVLALLAGCAGALGMLATLPLLPWLGQPPEVLAETGPYWVCVAIGLLPGTLMMVERQVLDAIDRPWLGVGLNALMVIVNMAVSWPLTFGLGSIPPLGLLGAGIGTLVAYVAGWLGCLIVIARMPGVRRWVGQAGPRWRAALQRQRREGAPMGLQYLLEAGAGALATLLVGLFGAVALAANQVTMSVVVTFYMVPLGMASAVGLRLAQAMGANERQRLWAIGCAGLAMVTLWMGGISLVMAAAGDWIASRFTGDAAVIAGAQALFVVIALMQVADGIQSVSLGALRGLLDSRWPTRVSLWCYWGLALPLGALLAFAFGLGPPGVWGGFGLGLVVAAVALTWRLKQQTNPQAPTG